MTDSDNAASAAIPIPAPNVQRLPVLLPRPHPHQPIRAIDADAFADIHLAHLTSDVPDSVLFPFLHGLEGDNYQQNSFFAASSGLDLGIRRDVDPSNPYPSRMHTPHVVKVPEYRGLMWVACEGDEHQANGGAREGDVLDSDEDLEFDSDDEYCQGESEDDFEIDGRGELMQVDDGDAHVDVVTSEDASTTESQLDAQSEDAHMHPQTFRKPSATAPIAIHSAHNHTSYFTSSSPSHHTNMHAHGAHAPHTIRFPTSESSPALMDHSPDSEELENEPHDRRLSTSSSIATSDSSSSVSTSASDSAHSHYGFSTSASYSTTASSVGQLKDLDTDADSASPTTESPVDTESTALTTPCTSPLTDVAIDDCIPILELQTDSGDVSSAVPPQASGDMSTATVATPKASADTSSDSTSIPPTESRETKGSINTHPEEELMRLTVASSFHANDLLTMDPHTGECMFVAPQVPSGISLRNFGIQVPIYATLSDIVVYSVSATPAATRAAFALAEKFKFAIERKAAERKRKYEEAGVEVVWIRQSQYGEATPVEEKDAVKIVCPGSARSEDAMEVEDCGTRTHSREPQRSESGRPRAYLVAYNVFVLTDPLHVLAKKAPWLVNRLPDPSDDASNEEDFFASRLHGVIRKDTTAAEPIAPTKPDGTANDFTAEHLPEAAILPAIDFAQRERDEMRELTKATEIIDDCVYLGNVKDCVPLYHTDELELARYKWLRETGECAKGKAAESSLAGQERLIDDPFDNSDNPQGYDVCIECRDPATLVTDEQIRAAEAHLSTLDALWAARHRSHSSEGVIPSVCPPRPPPSASAVLHLSFPASPPCLTYTHWHVMPFLNFLAGLVSPHHGSPSRPKRILIYSVDGYTESSVLALFLLMKVRGLDLPEAYLELQVSKGRSFFVYQSDLIILKRVEAQLRKERAALTAAVPSFGLSRSNAASPSPNRGERFNWTRTWNVARETGASHPYARSPSNSISYPSSVGHEQALSAPPIVVPSQGYGEFSSPLPRRPRAQTSPFLPPHVDHQTWFNDPRFDGSFPSRVLPFLYLGNLAHAQNAYMLHALGITHVVSVGECALVPPTNIATDASSGGYHLVAGRGRGGHGSLWMEEREGRIKVLDIKGVCDDGIDSLQHQLAPVCEWMERAREEGGTILVHCRVGVSRSATVTIAYVMKHLQIPLVDAYLIVRSRRLNVLIQPNMRLLYNLCGWEVELARERAKGDTNKFRRELARSINWPFLAREVHRLNEKYLH